MRSEIDRDLELMGLSSNDIRYKEPGNYKNYSRLYKEPIIFKQIEFDSSGGTEYFLSWESNETKPILYSFLRLRLSENSGKTQTGKVIFPELVNCALIRELHTYGKVQPCKQNQKFYESTNGVLSGFDSLEQNSDTYSQHKGYGKKLLEKAEQIAMSNGFKKIAVIAGVGVREYYRKQGYLIDSIEGCYQIKMLDDEQINNINTNTYIPDHSERIKIIFIGMFGYMGLFAVFVLIIINYFIK